VTDTIRLHRVLCFAGDPDFLGDLEGTAGIYYVLYGKRGIAVVVDVEFAQEDLE
jgi:hypothetical protein